MGFFFFFFSFGSYRNARIVSYSNQMTGDKMRGWRLSGIYIRVIGLKMAIMATKAEKERKMLVDFL